MRKIIWIVWLFLPGQLAAQFLPDFDRPGFNQNIYTLARFDDGGGERLYAAGQFNRIDGEWASSIAVWDGTSWAPVGAVDPANPPQIFHLIAHDDGSGPALYAAGDFTEIGGVEAEGMARWDGVSWEAFDTPPSDEVQQVMTYDDGTGLALYVALRVACHNCNESAVWKWNGQSWTEVFNGSFDDGQAWDDGSGEKLYIEGFYHGSSTRRIASWNGTTLTTLPGMLSAGVAEFAACDLGDGERLYAAGAFTLQGGAEARLVSWDGSAWRLEVGDVLPGFSGFITALCSDLEATPRLIIGGAPTLGGPVPVGSAYSWDGSTLSDLTSTDAAPYTEVSGALNQNVNALEIFDDGSGPALYAGGLFANDGLRTMNGVARWGGTNWQAVSTSAKRLNGLSAIVDSMGVFDLGDGPRLFAASNDTFPMGSIVSYGVGIFDGEQWSTLIDPAGTPARGIHAFVMFDSGSGPRLVAAGNFVRNEAPALTGLAEWDGVGWQPLMNDPDVWNYPRGILEAIVHDFGVGPRLFLAGEFPTAQGLSVNNIMEWDGTAFAPLLGRFGFGTNGRIDALAIFDDGSGPALYVGGEFTLAGGVASPYLARWDGSEWSAVGLDQLDGPVDALTVFDDGGGDALYIGGEFTQIGSLTVNHIAKWDGTNFAALPGASSVGVAGSDAAVWALHGADAGDGKKLYVSGPFETAGGVVAPQLAFWTGSEWGAPAGANASGFGGSLPPWALASFDDGNGPSLFAAGVFTTIYGMRSIGIGQYRVVVDIFSDGFESGDTSAWALP